MNQIIKINIVSIVFAGACLILYFLFPLEGLRFEFFIRTFLFFFVLPVLYVKIILHKNLQDIGLTTFKTDMTHIFYVLSAIIIGGLLSMMIVSLQWGVQGYVEGMTNVIFKDFRAFLIYELVFIAPIIFLYTFFVFGFVYSIKWSKAAYSYAVAFCIFSLLLFSLYGSFWIIIPLLVPALFIQKIYNDKNIIYIFIAVFVIALILDVFVTKTLI